MKFRLDPRQLKQELDGLRSRLRELTRLSDEGREERRGAALEDYGFFCTTYFPHQVEWSPSEFHAWLDRHLPRRGPGDRDVIAAPRGNAKTTKAARLYVLWRIARGDVKNVPIVQASGEEAEQTIEVLRLELEENPRLEQDFPEMSGPGRTWRQREIVTRNNIRVKGYGSGKRMRGVNWMGKRPDLVVCDDLENDENVASAQQREKLRRWFVNVVLKLGPPDGSAQFLVIGTILHFDSLLIRLSKRPDFLYTRFKAVVVWPANMDLWEEWERVYHEDPDAALAYYEARRPDMDAGAVVLWPAVQPLYDLMCERAADRRSFGQEMQNEPLDPDTQTFPAAAFTFWTEQPDILFCVGALDPALGKATGDFSAIEILGKGRDNKAYDLESDIGRYTPSEAIRRIIALQRRYRCVRWAIEEVAFQALVRDLLIQASLEADVPVPAVGVKPRFPKMVRIESLAPHVANGVLVFNPAHRLLLDQLQEWPLAANDDGPDVLELAFSQLYSASPIEFQAAPRKGGLNNLRRPRVGRTRGF